MNIKKLRKSLDRAERALDRQRAAHEQLCKDAERAGWEIGQFKEVVRRETGRMQTERFANGEDLNRLAITPAAWQFSSGWSEFTFWRALPERQLPRRS